MNMESIRAGALVPVTYTVYGLSFHLLSYFMFD